MGIYRDKKTSLYRYDFQLRGLRYTARGYPTKQKANDAEHERRKDIDRGRTEPFKDFSELSDAFLLSRERTVTKEWAYQLKVKLNKHAKPLARMRLPDIHRAHVESLLTKMAAAGAGASSQNDTRKILASVFNFAISMGVMERNPVRGVARVPEGDHPIEPIPTADLQKIILAADPYMGAFVVFLSQTGARWREASRLKWSEVFLDAATPFCVLTTRKRRGGHERKRPQPLTMRAAEALRSMVGQHHEYVFPGPHGGRPLYQTHKYRFNVLCERAGVPVYGFHQIRHWAGLQAAQLGKSKKAVALFLGHTDTSATERYLHASAPELWEIAQRLEQQMDEAGGVTSGETLGENQGRKGS